MDCTGNKQQLFPPFANLLVQPSLCFYAASC